MAKRKKYEQKENLDRWLLSYADFITLLFATFVVLYALSQVGLSQFGLLENAIKDAFSSTKITKQNIQTVYEEVEDNALTNTLVMEYVNSNYEKEAFNQIQRQINTLKSDQTLKNIDAKITEEGLIIELSDANRLFVPGTKRLNKNGEFTLSHIAGLIGKYFVLHQIKVEVHTDYKPRVITSNMTDWELAAMRAAGIVNLFIDTFKFMPDNMSAVGYGASRPEHEEISPYYKMQNNRVMITIVRNNFKNCYHPKDFFLKLSKQEQSKLRTQQLQIIENFYEFTNVKASLNQRNMPHIILDSKEIYKKEAKRLRKND